MFVQRECTIHSSLHHPNVICLFKYGEDGESYNLIMEYANRGNYLEQKLIDVNDKLMILEILSDKKVKKNSTLYSLNSTSPPVYTPARDYPLRYETCQCVAPSV